MIDFRIWQIAGWTMLHYLWVGAVLGLLAAAVRLLLRSRGANVRYLTALACFAVLGIAPLPIAVIVTSRLPTPPPRSEPLVASEHTPDRTLPPPLPPMENSSQPAATAAAVVSSPPPAPGPRLGKLLQSALDRAAMGLPWLWLIGAPLMFLLTTIGLLGAERLRRQSRLLEDSPIAETCRRLAAALGISRRAGVAICDRVAAPVLLGIFRPLILLPAVALTGWDPRQLEMVLLYELAHVRRWDNLVNLVQRVVESLLFFHPLVWIVSGWVRREREHCCDEVVVARTRQPRAYAEMLISLSDLVSHGTLHNSPLPHSQVVSSMAQHSLVARIRRILKKEEQSMQVSRKMVGLVFASLIGIAFVIGGYFSRAGRAADQSGKTSAAEPTKTTSEAPQEKTVDAKALANEFDLWLQGQRRGAWPTYPRGEIAPSKLNVAVSVPKAEVSTVLAYSDLVRKDIDVIVLPVKIENNSSAPIRTTLAHEWYGGEWPTTNLYVSVQRPGAPGQKPRIEFTPVFLAGEPVVRPGEPAKDDRSRVIDPGKSIEVSPRLDWPGTGSVHGGDIVDRPGVYKLMLLLVFEAEGRRQFVESEPVVLRYRDAAPAAPTPAAPNANVPSGKTSATKPADKASAEDKLSEEWTSAEHFPPPGNLPLPAYTKLIRLDFRQHYGIDAAQEKKLREVSAEYIAVSRKVSEEYMETQKLLPPERKAKQEEMGTKFQEAAKLARKKIEEVLTAAQKAAYKHDLRCDLALGLCTDTQEVAKRLGLDLSDRQKQRLEGLEEEVWENGRKKLVSTEERLLAVLTPQQRETLMARFTDADLTAPVVHIPPVESSRPRSLTFAVAKTMPPRPFAFAFISDNSTLVHAYAQLAIPAVRKELALTADQETKLTALQVKFQTAAQKLFDRYEPKPAAPKPSPEAQESQRAEYQRALEQFGKDMVGQIEAVLQPRQAAALTAIARKDKAIQKLMRQDRAVLDDLHATTEQRANLRKIYEEYISPATWLHGETGEKALGILTPPELEKLDETIERNY